MLTPLQICPSISSETHNGLVIRSAKTIVNRLTKIISVAWFLVSNIVCISVSIVYSTESTVLVLIIHHILCKRTLKENNGVRLQVGITGKGNPVITYVLCAEESYLALILTLFKSF